MKCQHLFSVKNKKNILKCCLLKFLPRVLSIKMLIIGSICKVKGTCFCLFYKGDNFCEF